MINEHPHKFEYYSIALNNDKFYLIPEPSLCPNPRNCSKEVYWGYITASTLNGGHGLIFREGEPLNDFMISMPFEFRMGVYSRFDIEIYEPTGNGDSRKLLIHALPELKEMNKFSSPKDAIDFIFPFLKTIMECKSIEDLKNIFS